MLPFLIVLALVIVGAVALVAIGLRNPQASDEATLESRLEELSKRGEVIDLEKIELSQPFTDRIIYPVLRKFGEFAIRFTPQNALQSISKKLEMAGVSSKFDPSLFLFTQIFCAALFGGLILLVFSVKEDPLPFSQSFLYGFGFAILGYFFPQLWISSKISQRQKNIRRAMPDALDLLTICVEAGLGFDAAMAKVSEKWQTELSLAFARVIQEVQLGKLRREAMRDMAERIGIPEMTSFVAAVIQSEQLGVSMSTVLQIQADQMRTKRRQHAEEEAHKAPLKMLIPMALLIFPSLMVVLMTPAALRLISSGVGKMFGLTF
ncbi:MAG TPA: type II secretion system F family protein [Anaerolineaceae bacterium]|nr:type II secretion system F family protein [Anaerolineaceae bacterium]